MPKEVKEETETADWMIEDFPVDLKNKFKAEAALKGKTMKDYLAEIIQKLVK